MCRELGMEVNLGLALGPLTRAAHQKNNLGFDSFKVEHSTIGGVDVHRNIRCFAVLVAPCTVIPATAYSGESKSLCDPNLHGLAVY